MMSRPVPISSDREPLTVAIVGCGAIGSAVAHGVATRWPAAARIVGLVDIDAGRASALSAALPHRPPVSTLSVAAESAALLIEAADQAVVEDVLVACAAQQRDAVILSVGGLLQFEARWEAARRLGCRVYVPSGAIAGIDGMRALAHEQPVRAARLTTRKPPRGLVGAPGVTASGIDIAAVTKPTVVFSGSVEEAIVAFPRNINVAATVALALRSSRTGCRPDVHVTVIADPTIDRNQHDIEVEQAWGRVACRVESEAAEANPRTSRLAVASTMALLDRILDRRNIGS